MADAVELFDVPQAAEMYMLAGWRQWADAGSASSGLPAYLARRSKARLIGKINPDGFYLYQIPGTHDLIRPVIKFVDGYPESLDTPENNLYYFESNHKGVVILVGDEPHLDAERYMRSILDVAARLKVKRIVGFGGVFGEFPYNKERAISGSFSLPEMRDEMNALALNLTNYQGGVSIGSYLCKRAGEAGVEYVGMYAMVPIYDFSSVAQIGHTIQIENDYMAWLGLMRRVNYMLKLDFDLGHLAQKSRQLLANLEKKVAELEDMAPEAGVREYFARLAEDFEETPFIPLDDVWEENLRKILDRMDDEDEENKEDKG